VGFAVTARSRPAASFRRSHDHFSAANWIVRQDCVLTQPSYRTSRTRAWIRQRSNWPFGRLTAETALTASFDDPAEHTSITAQPHVSKGTAALKNLHSIGPKAQRPLQEALQEHGLAPG
jgi:hypothetical protein